MFLIIFGLMSSFAIAQKPEILVIHSYSQGFPWTRYQQDGIQKTFEKVYPDLDIPVEYLDWKNFPAEENLALFKKSIQYKYAKKKLDVVIATDNAALDFVIQERQQLFKDAFIIFTGINDFNASMIAGQKRVSGVIEAPNYEKTIDEMLALHPGTKEIVIILDSTTISKSLLTEMQRLFPHWPHIRFNVLLDRSMDSIVSKVKSLREGSLVLVTNFTMDITGKKFTSHEVNRLISKVSPVPLYGLWDMQLGWGIIGGWLLDGYLQGKTGAELALQALKGEVPLIVTESPSRFFMDFKQMKRFNIPMYAVPKNTVFINSPPESIFQKYRKRILVAIVTIITLAILNIFLVINIRRRHKAERERDRLLIEEKNARVLAEEAVKARETFIAIAAHEFRTPLTVILFQLSLLLKLNRGETMKTFSKEEITNAINRALLQGKRLQTLVEDFLYVARQSTKQFPLQLEEIDFCHLVSDVVESLKEMSQKSGSKVEMKFTGPCKATLDKARMEKLVHNLITNAIKFGNHKPIEVSVTAEKEGLKLIVQDHGIGMNVEDRKRIFKKFGRAVSEFNFGGFGLGLFTCLQIVELHHGEITVESEPGKGSVFTVVLPYLPV